LKDLPVYYIRSNVLIQVMKVHLLPKLSLVYTYGIIRWDI